MLVLLLAVGLSWLTRQQVAVWQSSETLWTRAAQIAPRSPRPWVNMATIAIERNDFHAAAAHLARAEALTPSGDAWTQDVIAANYAVLLIRQGHLAQARAYVVGAPEVLPGGGSSARWMVCQRAPGLCQ